MADILCDCATGLDMSPFPCKADDYGYPSKILLLDTAGSITVAGTSPTLGEIQTALGAAGLDKMILIEKITNGQRIESEREEETGADTADGLTDTFSVNMQITGNIKLLDETVRAEVAALNCKSRYKMWFITNTGYIFGGATGFTASGAFVPASLEGFGTRASIPVALTYRTGLACTDPAGQDDGFINLVNP